MKSSRTALRCVCVAAAMIGAARGQTQIDLRTQGKNIDFSSAAETRPIKTGTLLPSVCTIGDTFLKTDAAAGKNLYVCTATNMWTVQGVELPSATGNAGRVLTTDGTNINWTGLGGDVSGTLSALIVGGLGGRKLGSLTPLDGQFLKWNGTTQQWEPTTIAGALSVFGRTGAITTQTGDYTFAQIAGSVANAQLPSAGGDLNGTLTSATVTGLQTRPVAATVPFSGQVLTWNGAQWTPQSFSSAGVTSIFGRFGAVTSQSGDYNFGQIAGTLASAQLPAAAGDLSGVLSAPVVAAIQSRPVAATTPALGQVLAWNGSQWAPQAQSGGVSSVFGRNGSVTGQNGDYSFSQISGTVASGQLPTAGGDLGGTLASATVSRLQSRPMSATLPLTGQVLSWDGTQWSPQTPATGGGSGGSAYAVLTTVGNTYSAGAKQTFVPSPSTSALNVSPGSLPTSPSAGDISVDSTDSNKLKVYDGSQWNTLVQLTNYVTTFTAQTTVVVAGTTHRLGTANLIAECYDNSSPAQKVEADKVIVDPLTFNVTISFASAQTGSCLITGSSGPTIAGGNGAGMASQLGDLSLVLTSSTVLSAGLNCSNAAPCNARLGSTVFTVTHGSTLTLTGGTGTVYLYLDPSGALTAGHNLSVTCAGGCAAVSGITAFPAGSIPLYTWTATNGTWDTNGGSDRRAFQSTRNVAAGAGIVALDTGTQTLVTVDSATVPSYLTSTAVLAFLSILPGACGESALALPGANTGDSVAPGWPAGLETGLIGMMRVSSAGTVAVRVCNFSGTTVTPAAATFRATVVRSF